MEGNWAQKLINQIFRVWQVILEKVTLNPHPFDEDSICHPPYHIVLCWSQIHVHVCKYPNTADGSYLVFQDVVNRSINQNRVTIDFNSHVGEQV